MCHVPRAVSPPAGIPIDGKTVFTSDHALKLDWLPNWIAIIGSGYIGLEFSDVYTALGTEVTFIEVRGHGPPRIRRQHAPSLLRFATDRLHSPHGTHPYKPVR